MPFGSSMMMSNDSTPIMENRRAGLLSKRQGKGEKLQRQNNDATPIIDIQTAAGPNYNEKSRPLTGRPTYFQLVKSQGNTPKSSMTRVFSANHLSPNQSQPKEV